MKFQTKINLQKGFTITELLVVISIMGVISTLVIAGFNQTRGRRDLRIAQNELITNIRKVQSYMLSSRDLPNGEKALFYVMRFEEGTNTYTIGGVSEDEFFPDLETVSFPNLIELNRMRIIGQATTSVNCAHIIFSAPYGKMYIDSTGNCDEAVLDILEDPAQLITRSDRQLDMILRESQRNTEQGVKIQTLSDSIRETEPYKGSRLPQGK